MISKSMKLGISILDKLTSEEVGSINDLKDFAKDFALKQQAKQIFKDIENALGFNDKDNYYTNATKIKYQEIKKKYMDVK